MNNKKSWRYSNIEEIRKRTLKYSVVNYGKIMVLDKNKEINLVQITDSKAGFVVKNVIDYNELKRAKSIDERLKIVVDATRDFAFYFYFEEKVAELIING